MGRPRSFDENAALTGAMEVFRRKGYVAVSIRDLEEATGLKAGSIYNSYGGDLCRRNDALQSRRT